MRRRFSFARTVAALVLLGIAASCGKRADPLAPYLKTPAAPSGLEVAQVGDEIEIRVTAPRTTTENRPLPVIQLEWYEAPATGDFGKTAKALSREDVAPGELRTKRFPKPVTDARFSVRAFQGKAQSNLAAPVAYKLAASPEAPTQVTATNTERGIELAWVNPPGAEPWPTPSLSPSPSPLPSGSPLPSASPITVATPSLEPPTAPAATPSVTEGSTPPAQAVNGPPPAGQGQPTGTGAPPTGGQPSVAVPSASATPAPAAKPPAPVPSPTPPTGIRIFRTDGPPRLAREPLQASSWLDTSPKAGEKPCYSLRYTTSFKPLVESSSTVSVCVDSKDIVPPEPPTRVIGDVSATFVELSWLASRSSDVAFYRVYLVDETGHGSLLMATESPVLRVRDPNMKSGARAYAVSAVDKAGNESVLSPALRVVVP